MVTYEQFKKIFESLNGEPEIAIYFKNRPHEYMLIKYVDHVTFQRCGDEKASGEIEFLSLDELYNSRTIDDICLKDDWDKIEDILIDEYLSIKDY